jgi:receptor expression-enhancing protein 5/6
MSNPSALTLTNVQERFRKLLNEDNFVSNLLAQVEQKTKVSREYMAYGIIGFLALYLVVGWGNDFLCNLIGFVYPAYASVKAIESTVKEDDTKWLMYWCVYALFGILEFFSDQLLFWIPFYTLTKCLFLIWAMIPGKNGGTYLIYNRVLRPFVLKHQDSIDRHIGQAKDSFGKVIQENLSKKE